MLACILLLAGLVPAARSPVAQQVDSEFTVLGGSYRLEQPSAIAVSPGGEKIAISDPGTNRIYVIDLNGRLLWIAGEQVRLDQPEAICFESESRILFAPRDGVLIMGVSEEDPRAVDTISDLSTSPNKWGRISQMTRRPGGDYVVLDRDAGEIAVFDADWENSEKLVNYGSGKGKTIAPSSFAMMASGKLVLADRKNFPVQIFSPEGKFLFYGGWNQPSDQHGWEAAAVAVDSRDFIWVADETNAQFRIFDQSGTLISALPFYHQAISPVAMTGTIDNRMAVLEQTGTLLFYTLE